MQYRIIIISLVGTVLGFSHAAMAAPSHPHATPSEKLQKAEKFAERKAEWEKLTPEEREKFRAERKAKWDALSREEKLKLINEKHDEIKKRMEERWNAMSDDEKIRFAEERMSRHNRDSTPQNGM